MRRHIRSAILGLFLVAAAALAIGCTPGGSGATTAPGSSGAPASVAPGNGY